SWSAGRPARQGSPGIRWVAGNSSKPLAAWPSRTFLARFLGLRARVLSRSRALRSTIEQVGHRQERMIAEGLLAGEPGYGPEESCGEPSGAQHALFLDQIVAIVLVDHEVGRLEVQAVQECRPALIEPEHSGDQVAGDAALLPDRGGPVGPPGCLG